MGVLISAAELADELSGPRPPRVLDVRWALGSPPGADEFRAGHIPGAVFADLDAELAAPASPQAGRHPLPALVDLQVAARAWGLRDGEPVVAYDDTGNLAAARAWWLLRWAGVGSVRLLDGGLAAWRALGREVETGEVTPEPGDVVLTAGALPTLEQDDIEKYLRSGGQLLDARAGERYRAEVRSVDPVPGHIPGAVSAPTTENLSAEKTFLDVAGLADRFAALGVEPDRPLAVYCGSGVTAAHEIAALELAGFTDVALYPGSYSQWASNPDLPIVAGAAPGSFPAPLISPEEAARLVASGAVLIDTRSQGNRDRTGAIPGAIITDRDDLEAEFGLDSAARHATVTSHETPIVVICGSINGFGPVAEALIGQGFVNVAHVQGGQPAWREAGLPVSDPVSEPVSEPVE